MSKQWYAVHTYAGQEEKIKQNIERRVESVGLATASREYSCRPKKKPNCAGNKKVTVKRKVFPGYVLVEMEMDDETWHFIRQTVGVTGFPGTGRGSTSRPTPLQPTEVDNLLGRMGEAAPQKRTTLFHKGERVNVVGGPFAGNEGTIDDINVKAEKLVVILQIFGRDTKVDLDFALVERIS
jgi:transcriptional antiterminator NusG